jgi:polyphosphate kinase
MTRNLERRVELLFPIQDEKLRSELKGLLGDYFRDNCKASSLDSKGTWTNLVPADGEKTFRVQKETHLRVSRANINPDTVKMEYNVRRSPSLNT